MGDEAAPPVRSFPVNLLPDPGSFPRDLFDPRWNDPRVAARVATSAYQRLFARADFDRDELAEDPPAWPRDRVDARVFRLLPPVSVVERGTRLVAGAYNELHRRYVFGGPNPTVNFHAQVVCFGVDAEGRYFLRATVGRYGGTDGNDVGLSASFLAGDERLGCLRWSAPMDPPDDVEVVLTGTSDVLRDRFDALTAIAVTLHGHHHGKVQRRAPRRSDSTLEAFGLFGG